MSQQREQAKIRIHRPPNCTRTSLSFDALDKHTKELAHQTLVEVDGKMLSTWSFKVNQKGCLIIEITPDAFEFVTREAAA